jgi:anti-sigma28 factor (negative regulator of flagellin synthesis)
MRILETGAFDELRKMELNKSEDKKIKRSSSDSASSTEAEVIDENKKALSFTLNNKSFEVNLETVEKIRNEIKNGEYSVNAGEVAKQLALAEKRGESDMGLFTG